MTTTDLAGQFDGKCHCLPVRVYFEDTDFTGVVYHARYLHFLERGRTDFLRLKGIHHADLQAGDYGKPAFFVVSAMTLTFKAAAGIDDLLRVETVISEMRGARIIMAQKIRRGQDLIVAADVEVVLVDVRHRPVRLPQALTLALASCRKNEV